MALAAAVLHVSCAKQPASYGVTVTAMGTFVRVEVCGFRRASPEEAVEAAVAEIGRLEKVLSRFDP